MKFKRIFLIVMDSLGVGEAIDAEEYNDKGCNTLGHLMENTDIFIPNLKKLGLLDTLTMNNSHKDIDAYYTIARCQNKGKDCVTGHYELMGIRPNTPFVDFNGGPFPRNLLEAIAQATKKPIVGNILSDTVSAIKRLFKRQTETKALIIYTTGDSNLEVAANENIIPLNDLYTYCEQIREITKKSEWQISSVVARPYIIINNNIALTSDSKIFTMTPPTTSVLDTLKSNNFQTISIGKINDIFASIGISKIIKSSSNTEGINKLIDIMTKNFEGLCFINLNDFGYLYGSSRNISGYKKSLEEFDVQLPLIINELNMDDLLIITSDHGNDLTLPNFNHTRENVPVLLYSRSFIESGQLDILNSLADIGATIADNFNVEKPWIGESFLDKLK